MHGGETIRDARSVRAVAFGASSTPEWTKTSCTAAAPRDNDIAEARLFLRRDGYPAAQDRLITMVTFGFWRYLLSARYEHSLWVPALRKAFPHVPNGRRKYIAGRVERLHYLRNRIAHHEPVFPRRLDRDLQEAIDVVAAICPTSAAWLVRNSWTLALDAVG